MATPSITTRATVLEVTAPITLMTTTNGTMHTSKVSTLDGSLPDICRHPILNASRERSPVCSMNGGQRSIAAMVYSSIADTAAHDSMPNTSHASPEPKTLAHA